MASGPLVVKLEIKADGTAAIVGLNKVQGALDTTGKKGKEASGGINSPVLVTPKPGHDGGRAVSVAALAQVFHYGQYRKRKAVKGPSCSCGFRRLRRR